MFIMILVWIFIAIIIVYAFSRNFLIKQFPRWAYTTDKIDHVALALWAKSRTVLIGRLLWLGGAILSIHDSIALSTLNTLDWQPLTSRFLDKLPPDMQPLALPVLAFAVGQTMVWLRKRTFAPLPEKDPSTSSKDIGA